MLQINVHPNQDGLIVYSSQYQAKCHIQPLSSNEIYKFDISIQYPHCKTTLLSFCEILAISNGLVLVKLEIVKELVQLLVYNPAIEECIELLEFPTKEYFVKVCDFFEHDLQTSSYKIFLVHLQKVYIYNSSSHKWQAIDSFTKFQLNLKFTLYYLLSCIMYKNNIYVAFNTSKEEWMMVYNPKDDAWNNLGGTEKLVEYIEGDGRLIIVDDCLFYANVSYGHYYKDRSILSIFEIKIEDRLLIPITKITWPYETWP